MKKNVKLINGPELISKYVGESAANLRNILDVSRLNPEVTYVVIIDALIGSRDQTEGLTNQTKGELTTTLYKLALIIF
jgi:SpoVK/Ycf46/Vps4 family AAA+-type ATPase